MSNNHPQRMIVTRLASRPPRYQAEFRRMIGGEVLVAIGQGFTREAARLQAIERWVVQYGHWVQGEIDDYIEDVKGNVRF